MSKQEHNKVAVVGAGAMGCMFAARLQKAGINTVLVARNAERASDIEESGIKVETDGESYTASPSVRTSIPDDTDLIIILVKAYSTKSLDLPANKTVLTLQNGLGNAECLCSKVGSANVLGGTTCEAVTLLSVGHVRHVAEGQTLVGSWTSCPAEPAVAILRKAGFNAEVTEAPGQEIWGKVVMASGINSLTSLTGMTNGKLLECAETRQLLRDLVVEAAKVAASEGYRFEQSMVEKAEEVCRQTADNISSMLQDVRNGRQTEIDAISGAIMERAELTGLPVPRTRVVWQLLKGLESR